LRACCIRLVMAPNSPRTRSGRSSLLRVRTSKRQSSCIVLTWHRTDEIVRPGHALQGTDAFPEDALDEQKLLDRLSQLGASPGSKGDGTVPAPIKIENCKLDLAGHTFVDGNGREVRLTRAEIALLTAFVDSPRRVLSREQLRYAVAGRGAEPYDRSVDMLVARLRRKIEPDPKTPRFILSVPGVGYKFDHVLKRPET
jgi:DNA-binding response OmpR family regulator